MPTAVTTASDSATAVLRPHTAPVASVAAGAASAAPAAPAAPAAYAGYQIIRRNGAVVGFEPNKIAVALMKAFLAVHGT